jgi:hypothetical protein
MLPSAISEASLLNETYNNMAKTIALLVVLGILIASSILLCCYGIGYYLIDRGLSIYQVLSIIIGGQITIIAIASMFLKNNLQQIKGLGDNKEEANPSTHYHIVQSFMNGFNNQDNKREHI